ncbi:MAG: hypothetical protein DI537_34710 [Stutzerimonas stutzeri]|nr:MAG: hypothetical protein DI537_34710 [Stutzerimonas stutzeri]
MAAANDPSTAVNQRYADSKDTLERSLQKDGNIRAYQSGLDAITKERDAALKDIQDAKKRPSADTLARRQESARQKVLSDDISYNDEERQARKRLVDAMGRTAATEEQRTQLLVDDINAEAAATARKIALEQDKGKISAAEAAHLNDLNEQTRLQRLKNVEIEKASALITQQAETDSRSLDTQIAILRIQLDMATTAAERRRLAQELLKAEQAQARVRLNAVANDPRSSESEKAQAQADLRGRDQIDAAQQKQFDLDHASPLARYKSEIDAFNKDIDTAIEELEVRGLDSLTDGFADAITGAKSFGDVFKGVAKEIIADLIRIAIRQTIVNQLMGALGGISGGSGGGGLGSIFGFATGGYTGDGNPSDPAGIVHKGEYVFDAPTVRSIGRGTLEAIRNGTYAGPSVSARSLGSTSQSNGTVKVQLELSGDLDARIASGATNVAVDVVRSAQPALTQAAVSETTRQLGRGSL